MQPLLPINYPYFVALDENDNPHVQRKKDGTLSMIVLSHSPDLSSGKPFKFDDPFSLCNFARIKGLLSLSFDMANGTMFTVSTADFMRQSLLDPSTN